MASLTNSAGLSTVRQFRPLEDNGWDDFVRRARNSSIFHTRAWLEALRRTYGYEPVAFTTSRGGLAPEDCLLFCQVKSWLTGSRLVSLPFSDHCALLVENPDEIPRLAAAAEHEVLRQKMDYLELRPPRGLRLETSLACSEYTYAFHEMDLTLPLEALFCGFHKDSIQRKIRRAEREALVYEEGRSDRLLDAFYGLMVMTRQRHQVPPQPRTWFANLRDCVGDLLKIRLAVSGGRPAAAVLTLRHKNTLVYKYGASDPQFHKLGAMHLLLWKCIREAKREGLRTFDLGRSNPGNSGLIVFKDRWGAKQSTLTYTRYGIPGRFEYRRDGTWKEALAKFAISRLPGRLFTGVGQLLYPHVG